MLDHHPEYVPLDSDGYTSNHPSNTGELEDSLGHHRLQWGTSTTFRPFFDNEVASADQRMGDLPPTELPDEVSQHHWDFAGRSDAQNYGHLDANISWTPSVAEDSREGASADSDRLQWTSLSTRASLDKLDISNNDNGTEDLDENDEVIGTYASDYFGSAELFAPQPSLTAEHAVPHEGSNNVFSHGVLSREHGHEEALDPYTSQLLSRLGKPDRGLQSHMDTTMGYPTSLDPRDWAMSHYEMDNAPEPLQPRTGQQQMDVFDFAPANGFQYQIREDTPVHQTDVESRFR